MKKAKEYLLEFFVIFFSISVAFISDNWRENLQDKEDFELILEEINANLKLDSVEFAADISFIESQLRSIERLLDSEHPCPIDSLEFHFNRLMYNFRWPDVKATGIDQLRSSKNLDPHSELISKVNNYYTWTEYLKGSTPYQYILPQNTFNDWIIQQELVPLEHPLNELKPEVYRQLDIRLYHLGRTKQVQLASYRVGISKIVDLLHAFDERNHSG